MVLTIYIVVILIHNVYFLWNYLYIQSILKINNVRLWRLNLSILKLLNKLHHPNSLDFPCLEASNLKSISISLTILPVGYFNCKLLRPKKLPLFNSIYMECYLNLPTFIINASITVFSVKAVQSLNKITNQKGLFWFQNS